MTMQTISTDFYQFSAFISLKRGEEFAKDDVIFKGSTSGWRFDRVREGVEKLKIWVMWFIDGPYVPNSILGIVFCRILLFNWSYASITLQLYILRIYLQGWKVIFDFWKTPFGTLHPAADRQLLHTEHLILKKWPSPEPLQLGTVPYTCI